MSAETVFTKNSGRANGASAIFSFIFKRIRPFPSASVPGIPFGFLKEVPAVPEYPHRFRQEFLLRTEVPHVLSLVGLSHKAKVYPTQLSGGEDVYKRQEHYFKYNMRP